MKCLKCLKVAQDFWYVEMKYLNVLFVNMDYKYKKCIKGVTFYLSVIILLVSEQVIFKIKHLLTRNYIFSHNLLTVISQCHDHFNAWHFLWNLNIGNV